MNQIPQFDIMAFLPYLLNQASEQTSREFQKHYRERYGMLRTEWRVLFHLGHHGEMTANDVVIAAKVHKTKVSRAVQALEEKGFLKRTQDKEDRRREQLSLTQRGISAYESLSLAAKDYENSLIKDFSEAELKTVKEVLSKIRKRGN